MSPVSKSKINDKIKIIISVMEVKHRSIGIVLWMGDRKHYTIKKPLRNFSELNAEVLSYKNVYISDWYYGCLEFKM